MGMRNHIAHGYFDINTDLVFDVVRNDLLPLLDATNYFISHVRELIPVDEGSAWSSPFLYIMVAQ